MMRFAVLAISIGLAFSGSMTRSAAAQTNPAASPADEIRTTLRSRGYRIVQDEQTWLGRQRVIAEKNGARRELVFNPATGEILRDYSSRVNQPGASRSADNGQAQSTAAPSTETAGSRGAPGESVGNDVGIGAGLGFQE